MFCIAIIGGGIGGTSCAYFLRDLFKDSVQIDLYEGNQIGGRLATVIMSDGNEYETGGSVIHQRNKYMSDFVRNLGELYELYIHCFIMMLFLIIQLGLQKRTSVFKDEKLGLYNGHNFDFIENDYHWLNVLKIFWRYGYSIKYLQDFVNGMLDKFER